jgi:hypothetical protein
MTNADNAWEFDVSGWTLGEDALYIEQLREAQRNGNMQPLFAHWARMIRHWPFALHPRDLTSYAKLDEATLKEIIQRLDLAIRLPKREDSRMGGGET